MYGGIDDCCSIHEIDVPFIVDTDLMFYYDNAFKDIMENYNEFFIPDKFNWVILPVEYWEIYKAGDLMSVYDESSDQYILYDKSIGMPIDQIQMQKARPINDYQRAQFHTQLEGLLNTMGRLGPVIKFTGMENNPAIRKAFDNKADIGRVLLKLNDGTKDILIFFYKGLFSLNKNDTLDIDIQFDQAQTNLFMATYRPKKKKNPVSFNTYGTGYNERIYCMYMNLA